MRSFIIFFAKLLLLPLFFGISIFSAFYLCRFIGKPFDFLGHPVCHPFADVGMILVVLILLFGIYFFIRRIFFNNEKKSLPSGQVNGGDNLEAKWGVKDYFLLIWVLIPPHKGTAKNIVAELLIFWVAYDSTPIKYIFVQDCFQEVNLLIQNC